MTSTRHQSWGTSPFSRHVAERPWAHQAQEGSSYTTYKYDTPCKPFMLGALLARAFCIKSQTSNFEVGHLFILSKATHIYLFYQRRHLERLASRCWPCVAGAHYEGDWSRSFWSDPPVPPGAHPGHLVFRYDAHFFAFWNSQQKFLNQQK